MLDSPITQKNLTLSNQRIWIGGFPSSFETSLQFALHHSFRTARVRDNLIGQHIAKRYLRSERRILGFRLHGKIAIDLAAPGTRRHVRKLEHIGFVAERGLQLLQKKAVSQRNLCDLCVAVKSQSAAYAGMEIDAFKTREQCTRAIEKTEIPVFDADLLNLRSNRQPWFLLRELIHP